MKVLGPALNLGAKPIIPVPAGGAQGQVLAKNSATDYDLAWANPSTDGGGAANTLNFRGAFSTSGTYAVDDLVSYNGAFYICKNAVAASGSAPTDATGSLTYTTQPGNWPVNDGDYSTMAFDCGSQASCTVTSATPVVFNSFRVYDCPAYPAYTLALAGVTSLVLKVDGVVVNTITTCPAKVSDAHGGYYELDFGSVTGLSASVTFHFTASDFVGSEIRTFTGGVVPLTAPDTDPTDWLLLIPAPTAAYTPPTGLMTYQGAFSSAANYAVDSVVSYNGAYYLAKKAVTAFVSAPTDISAAVTYAGSGFGAFTGDACKNGNLTDYAYDTGGFTNSTFTFTAVPGTVFNCVRFYDTPQYPTWGMAAALISSIVLKVDGVTVNTLGAAPALTNGYFEVDFGNVSGTVATVTFYEGRTFMGAEARVFSGPTPAPNPTTDTTDWLLLIPAAGAAAPGTMVDTGAYSGAATYALGNVVSYGGKYYVAKCAVSPPPAGVTWDAVNSSATLSNGNLTALCSSSQAFSNTFKTAGKWYAEYVVVSGTEATFAVSSASGTEVGWASAKAFPIKQCPPSNQTHYGCGHLLLGGRHWCRYRQLNSEIRCCGYELPEPGPVPSMGFGGHGYSGRCHYLLGRLNGRCWC